MIEEDLYIPPVAPAHDLFLSHTKDERDLQSMEALYIGV